MCDEYSRRDAREAIPASHHVVIPRPLQLGWNGRICVRGLVASRAVPAGIYFWVSDIALAAMSILAFRWLPLPSAPEDAEKVASGGTITWFVPLNWA